MAWFSFLKKFFCRQSKDEELEKRFERILETCCSVITPSDLFAGVGLAIILHTAKMVEISLDEIKLYALRDKKSKAFLGSFYAVKHDGLYYGSFVGTDSIVVCAPDAFLFKETDKVYVPLKKKRHEKYTMCCRLHSDTEKLDALIVLKEDRKTGLTVKVYSFRVGCLFPEAIRFCRMNGYL